MKKLSIYLDTSILNFLFAEDAPEKQDITKEFFEGYVKPGVYIVSISPVVIDEINKTSDRLKKTNLLNILPEYHLPIINIEPRLAEIQSLANTYLEKGIVPRNKIEDALHVAISTVFEMDVLLSWNYRHLANVHRERKFFSVNIQEGYLKTLRLIGAVPKAQLKLNVKNKSDSKRLLAQPRQVTTGG